MCSETLLWTDSNKSTTHSDKNNNNNNNNKNKLVNVFFRETPFDTNLINRYKKALDTAVKLATVYNVQPIRGRTVILCNTGPDMEVPCTAARGLGKPRTVS